MSEVEIARLEERIAGVKERAARIDILLAGFPQIYALRDEMTVVQADVAKIRVDHVQRREIDTVKERMILLENRLTYLYGGFAVSVGIVIAAGVKVFAS